MAHAVGPAPQVTPGDGASGVPRRLLQVIADLNADLDHSLVFGRICRACVELTGAQAAAFLVIDGEQAHVAAGVGLPLVPRRLDYSVSAAGLADLVGDGGRHVIPDFAATTRRSDVRAALGPLHTAVLTGVIARGQLVGVLTALYEEVDHRVSEAEGELFDVLASCGGVAIANSMTYENVVRAEEHHAGVIDGIADGVAVLDSYGLVTGVEPGRGRPHRRPGGPGDRPALPAPARQPGRADRARPRRRPLGRADGRPRSTRARSSPSTTSAARRRSTRRRRCSWRPPAMS